MSKGLYMTGFSFFLSALLIGLLSCERSEIKPGQAEALGQPETISGASSLNKLVGTWVRYSGSRRDTLRFSDNGVLIYTLGNESGKGNVYRELYFYECTEHYLVDFKDSSDYNHTPHCIEFNEDNTQLLLGNFTFLPTDVAQIYAIRFKKIE